MLVIVLVLFIISIVLHESGHYLSAKIFGANPHFRIYKKKILTRSYPQTKTIGAIITFTGILMGLIPMVVTFGFIDWYWSMLLFLSMISGSIWDFIHLYKLLCVYIVLKQDTIHSEAKNQWLKLINV